MTEITIDSHPPVPGRLAIEREAITQMSALPRIDPSWTYTDAAGHFHAYGDDVAEGRDHYPTLRAEDEHHPCDGACGDSGCEGYYTTRHLCRICGEEIEPGMLTGPHTFIVPGRLDWHADVVTTDELPWLRHGERVTVRADDGRYTYFGVGIVDIRKVTGGPDGVRTEAVVQAAGPLGRRAATRKRTSAP